MGWDLKRLTGLHSSASLPSFSHREGLSVRMGENICSNASPRLGWHESSSSKNRIDRYRPSIVLTMPRVQPFNDARRTTCEEAMKLTIPFMSSIQNPLLAVCAGLVSLAAQAPISVAQEVLRIGMIGLDTSHAPAFAKQWNASDALGLMAKQQVVVAYPGGSPDIQSSHERVPEYTAKLAELGVKIVDSIDALVSEVDAVVLTSLDGRRHLEQALPVLRAGKPLYLDKPLAGTLADAIAIQKLAEKYGVKWFSSSSLRFSPSIWKYRMDPKWRDQVRGAIAWSPCSLEATHPDFFWYGVHGCETLFTVMGVGCEQVTRVSSPGTDAAIGLWAGGRIGEFRGLREGSKEYGLLVFGEKTIETGGKYEGYGPLVEEIAKFFESGVVPVTAQETIELFAFMEAADESKRRGGAPVKIAEVLAKASEEATLIVSRLTGP